MAWKGNWEMGNGNGKDGVFASRLGVGNSYTEFEEVSLLQLSLSPLGNFLMLPSLLSLCHVELWSRTLLVTFLVVV